MKNARIVSFARTSFVLLGALLLLFLFKDVDGPATLDVISRTGFFVIPIVGMYFIGGICETFAWRSLFPGGRTIPFFRLLLIHFAGESLYRFLPAGAVAGESLKVILVKKHFALSSPVIISSLTVRKFLMGFAQALYIAGAVAAGMAFSNSGGMSTLELTGIVIAVSLLALFTAFGILMSKGSLFERLVRLMTLFPSKRVRVFFSDRREQLLEIDSLLRSFISNNKKTSAAALFLFFLGWGTEFAETFFILAALAVFPAVSQIMLFEPVISFFRSVVFFIPGGLGMMDVGYAASLKSFGIHNAVTTAAAFILLKRGKEIFWIIVGVAAAWMLGRQTNSNADSELPRCTVAGETF